MNDIKIKIILTPFIHLILFLSSFIINQINDEFKYNTLESSDSYLIDINDYHNLGLIMTTSKKIYFISSFEETDYNPITFNLSVSNFSMGATYNNNYLLVACLEDSLLAKININNGESESLLNYGTYDGKTLEPPNQICSLSIFENFIYITIANEEIKEETIYNKYYIIRINIKNDDTSGPIIDDSINKVIFQFSDSYKKILTLKRQISCEIININPSENRLVCIHESISSGRSVRINATALKNDLSGIDVQYAKIYNFNYESGFICFKFDESILTCNVRKYVYNISLNYQNSKLQIKVNKHIQISDTIPDLLYYVNNFSFSSRTENILINNVGTNVFYIKIESSSNNYYIIYDYLAVSSEGVKKLLAKYDNSTDTIFCFYHSEDKIKYFYFKSDVINGLFNKNSYSKNYRIISNDDNDINLEDDFVETYGTCEIQNTLEYTENDVKTYKYRINSDNFNNFPYNKTTNILKPPKTNNYWYQYNFAYIDDGQYYLRMVYLNDVKIFIETCAYQCSECSDNYHTCTNCRNSDFSKLKDHLTDSNCYPINQTFEGYIYNNNTKIFEKCYKSCKFCSESVSDNPSSSHKCKVCSDGYYPSYQYLGNCYKINDNEITSEKYVGTETDESFTLQSCSDISKSYKINSTGECVDACPTQLTYYSYVYTYINFTEQTNKKISDNQYKLEYINIPKYSFNNICYENCPVNTIEYNSDTNICVCQFAWHKDITTNKIICYENDYCMYQDYKYYYDDTKECKQNGDTNVYYQFNFECFKEGCPSNTNGESSDSHICESIYTYCYVNEKFKTICSDTQNEEYKYKYENTKQYLKSCDESLIYTTVGSQTYLYNKTCYLSCPNDITDTDNVNKICICKYFGYYMDDDNYICYRETEICDDKIPVVDIKKCLDTVDDCINKEYKIFNNKCYTTSCPELTEESNENNFICKCKFSYYEDNNLLNCFEQNECESEYLYSNPETLECFLSLNDCFSKNNLLFYNTSCYKNNCPIGKIPLNSINDETIKNKLISELSISNDLINHQCVCDIINNEINWNIKNINEDNFLQICVNECDEQNEPDSLTRKCVEKCDITKHYVFNDICYKEGCPEGSKLNESNPNSRICECEKSSYIDNGIIICCDESEGTCPSLNLSNCPLDYKIYKYECYSKCPDGTCLTPNDINLITCINIESYMTVLSGICIDNLADIIDNIKNNNDKSINSISNLKDTVISGYFAEDEVYESSATSNYSLLFLNDCKDLLKKANKLADDTQLFILQMESTDKVKKSAINSYNYGIFLENGTQLDLSACEGSKITLSSPIIDPESVYLDKAIYFSEMNYDIYDEDSNFYTDTCAPASITGNDITLKDRKTDFYPSNVALCNDSCEYGYVNLTTKRFVCDCDAIPNITEDNNTNSEDNYDDSSYIDYFLSLMNYKITKCFSLIKDISNFKSNIGFYLSIVTTAGCTILMFIFIIKGINLINKCIYKGIPTKSKLLKRMKELEERRKNNIKEDNSGNPPKKRENENDEIEKEKKSLEKEEKDHYHLILKLLGRHPNKLNEKENEENKEIKTKNSNMSKETKNTINSKKNKKNKKRKDELDDESEKEKKSKFYMKKKPIKSQKKKNRIGIKDENKNKVETIETLVTKEDYNFQKNNLKYGYKPIGFKYITEEEKKILKVNYKDLIIINDDIDIYELNGIPYSQAVRIDNRNIFQIFYSVITSKIEILSIFYYRHEAMHISLAISIYLFSLLLDLTLNCFLYSDDVVSEKYHNEGKLEFVTSFVLSLLSNIFSAIIVYIIAKLTEFSEILEIIIRDVCDINHYYENIIKFKKIIKIKLTIFFIIQFLMNLFMLYYLSIFCIVFSKSQTSILLNYLYGILESLIISLGIALVITLIRYFGIKYKWEAIYNTSKYLYETL